MAHQGVYSLAKTLSRHFLGRESIIGVPKVFILWTGDPAAAIMLSQLAWLTENLGDEEGWIGRSNQYWLDEFGLNDYTVRASVKRLKELGIGLETKRKMVNGKAITHYRIDFDTFDSRLITYLQSQDRTPKNRRSADLEFADRSAEGPANFTDPSYIREEESKRSSSEGVGEGPKVDPPRPKRPDRNPYMDTLAFYLWSVPIGEKLGREIGGRAGRVLRAIREAFPDEAMPSPDALAEAFEWKKRTAPHLNLPRKPEGVLAILYEYRDFTRRKAQGAPATTGPGTVPYVRALTAEEIERARHPDDDDIPPIPKPKVDYRGFPIPSDDDQGGDT